MNDDSISVTLTRAQAQALLACAEVGFDGAEDAGVPAPLCDAAAFALGALRGALALLDPEPSREIVDPSACPCGDPSCGGCGLS